VGLARGLIENTLIDSVGNGVIDELAEDQAICRQASDIKDLSTRCPESRYSPLVSSKSCMVSVGIGSLSPISESPASTYDTQWQALAVLIPF
jgi:hypothetical protein